MERNWHKRKTAIAKKQFRYEKFRLAIFQRNNIGGVAAQLLGV